MYTDLVKVCNVLEILLAGAVMYGAGKDSRVSWLSVSLFV